jgi:hypothetical protein
MQLLKECISKNGHIYTQLDRSECVAVYEMKTKEGILAGHEVFLITVRPKRDIYGTIYPQKEAFPSNEAFGVSAWSTGLCRERAMNRFKLLQDHV